MFKLYNEVEGYFSVFILLLNSYGKCKSRLYPLFKYIMGMVHSVELLIFIKAMIQHVVWYCLAHEN